MRFVLWGVFVLVAAVWTGGAALTAQLAQWLGEGLASGAGASVGTAAATMAIPPWLAPWIDPAAWAALQQMASGALESMAALMPAMGGLVSWLAPLVWVFWGLGLVVMLGLTVAGHWLLGRLRPGAQPAPVA